MMVALPSFSRPPLRPRLRLAVILVLALVVASLMGNRGLVQLYRMRQTREALQRENAQLTLSNAALAEEVRALRADPVRIEAIAREELGLVRPGELVYEFRAAARPSQSQDAR